jgi:hypothetical protein
MLLTEQANSPQDAFMTLPPLYSDQRGTGAARRVISLRKAEARSSRAAGIILHRPSLSCELLLKPVVAWQEVDS